VGVDAVALEPSCRIEAATRSACQADPPHTGCFGYRDSWPA
jgi:hypothetical protein